jgi:thioredoxin reductase (NADPH)
MSDKTLVDRARRASIAMLAGPCRRISIGRDFVELTGGCHRFESLYPALGSTIRSELAMALGATLTGEGCVVVDRHQRTSVPHLFAAGDVVLGLDQISHAMGEGGVAATAIRNDLAAVRPLHR